MRASLDLGLIGNGAISALIDREARLVWCCMPRFDSDPVFDALLDSPGDLPADGSFQIGLEDCVRTEQAYEHGTAVLRTQLFDSHGGGIEVRDFAPRHFENERSFHPMLIVRRVRPLQGAPRVRIVLRPRARWGRAELLLTRGSNHLRYVAPELTLRLTTNAPLTYVVDETPFVLNTPISLLLGYDEVVEGGIEHAALRYEEHTLAYWREWVRRLAIPLEWQEAVIRAAITLKLCLYEDTGAIVAAMTTSIPEAPNTQRTWDYRYCWLRDAFFVVRALNSLSEVGTLEDYLRWLQNVVAITGGGPIQPLYGIGLERELKESIVEHLAGYRGMGPVRLGNQAFDHFQHDVYGNIVLGATQFFFDHRLLRRGGTDDFGRLEAVGERAWALHDQPDAGMWELRTRKRVHTSSVLMNWAACDRLAKIALKLGLAERAAHWRERAATIRTKLLEQAWNERRRAFVESFGGRDLDASVLLMAAIGFIAPHDPRFVSTLEALEATLCDGPYMRRYEGPDDFGRPETAFNICAFWRIDALARVGRREQAREIFETLLATRNHVGLLSEDTHPDSGEMWGNFPQTYSMVGIINGAVQLSAAWETQI